MKESVFRCVQKEVLLWCKAHPLRINMPRDHLACLGVHTPNSVPLGCSTSSTPSDVGVVGVYSGHNARQGAYFMWTQGSPRGSGARALVGTSMSLAVLLFRRRVPARSVLRTPYH